MIKYFCIVFAFVFLLISPSITYADVIVGDEFFYENEYSTETSWINSFIDFFTKIKERNEVMKEGDRASIDFTFYDSFGRPVVTTSQEIYQENVENEDIIFLAGAMPIVAGSVSGGDLIPIEVFSQYTTSGLLEFGLFGPELDEMGYAIIGQKVGSVIDVEIPMAKDLIRFMDNNQFIQIAGDILDFVEVGDQVPIAFSKTPQIALDDATPQIYLRTATIT